jgi:hypothetical protein
MGRIGRNWELIEKSVSILARNKSLMFLPVASAIASMAISVAMLSGGALLFRPEIQFYLSAGPGYQRMTQPMWIFLFVFYLVNYFIVIYFNVALVTIVSRMLAGGTATVSDGLQAPGSAKVGFFSGPSLQQLSVFSCAPRRTISPSITTFFTFNFARFSRRSLKFLYARSAATPVRTCRPRCRPNF